MVPFSPFFVSQGTLYSLRNPARRPCPSVLGGLTRRLIHPGPRAVSPEASVCPARLCRRTGQLCPPVSVLGLCTLHSPVRTCQSHCPVNQGLNHTPRWSLRNTLRCFFLHRAHSVTFTFGCLLYFITDSKGSKFSVTLHSASKMSLSSLSLPLHFFSRGSGPSAALLLQSFPSVTSSVFFLFMNFVIACSKLICKYLSLNFKAHQA